MCRLIKVIIKDNSFPCVNLEKKHWIDITKKVALERNISRFSNKYLNSTYKNTNK